MQRQTTLGTKVEDLLDLINSLDNQNSETCKVIIVTSYMMTQLQTLKKSVTLMLSKKKKKDKEKKCIKKVELNAEKSENKKTIEGVEYHTTLA